MQESLKKSYVVIISPKVHGQYMGRPSWFSSSCDKQLIGDSEKRQKRQDGCSSSEIQLDGLGYLFFIRKELSGVSR